MKRVAYLCGTLFLLAWPWASCSLDTWAAVARVPVEELVSKADLIAVVVVLTVQELPQTSQVKAILQIKRVLKATPGFAAPSIEVRVQSRRVPPGASRRLFNSEASYRVGELAVVFLKASSDGAYFELVQGILGKRTIFQGRVAGEDISLEAFIDHIQAAASSLSVPATQ